MMHYRVFTESPSWLLAALLPVAETFACVVPDVSGLPIFS